MKSARLRCLTPSRLCNSGSSENRYWGVIVADIRERPVLAILDGTIGYGHRHLHVRVVLVPAADVIALEPADAADRHAVAARAEVDVEHVLEGRAVVDARIRVARIVDAEIGQVVLLVAAQRPARPEVEALAPVEHLQSPPCMCRRLSSALASQIAQTGTACTSREIR